MPVGAAREGTNDETHDELFGSIGTDRYIALYLWHCLREICVNNPTADRGVIEVRIRSDQR